MLELLVVLTLSSILMVALFSTFRAGIGSWRTAERHIERVESARQLLNLLHRQLFNASPVMLGAESGAEFSFQGDASRIRYVAPLSLSTGGAIYLIELQSAPPGSYGVWVRFGLYDGRSAEEILAGSELQLVSDTIRVDFAYLQAAAAVGEGAWSEDWSFNTGFPSLVRVAIEERGRVWPTVVMRVGYN